MDTGRHIVHLSYGAIIIVTLILSISSFALNPIKSVYTQSENNQPSINSTSLFDTGQMILPGNVKHLVILIPDEGHHGPGEEDESRFIAQPFVPQSAVVSPGTEVVWV